MRDSIVHEQEPDEQKRHPNDSGATDNVFGEQRPRHNNATYTAIAAIPMKAASRTMDGSLRNKTISRMKQQTIRPQRRILQNFMVFHVCIAPRFAR